MFSWNEFEKSKSIFSQARSYKCLAGQHHISIRPVELLSWIELVSEDLGFFTLVEMACAPTDNSIEEDFQFEMSYHLLNMGTHQRLNLQVRFNKEELIPDLRKYFVNADWHQREQQERWGIHFDVKTSPLLLSESGTSFRKKLKINPNRSEPPYPEEAYTWKHYDLLSEYSLGLFDLNVCYGPTQVVDSHVEIGFHHQGLEKLLEAKQWQQALQLVDKVNPGAAPHYAVAWSRAMEDLGDMKIPERAQAIRMVLLELVRIADHLSVMHEVTYVLKLEEHKLFLNAREKIYELIEKYAGNRQAFGIIRLGGVKEDLPHGWVAEYQYIHQLVIKALTKINGALLGQNDFREQLSGGGVSAQSALLWGLTGPGMRASGINFDLRKSAPFYFYQDVDFDIPVGIHGSAYERYLIRYEEIFQSFRIITQVVDNLPPGEVINPALAQGYQQVQEFLSGLKCPGQWHYSSLESPNGEAGLLIKLDNCFKASRVKIKSPSFALAQAMALFISGIQEGQLKAFIASMGLRQSELDR